jgi:hypothetical protein
MISSDATTLVEISLAKRESLPDRYGISTQLRQPDLTRISHGGCRQDSKRIRRGFGNPFPSEGEVIMPPNLLTSGETLDS